MGPLDGIKVIDISRSGPGRYTAMMLADLGAEVITIETPRTPESNLSFMFTDDTWYRYVGMNCNKKSIAINLKNEIGRKLVYGLTDEADILIEAFRPGVPKRLCMDYETLSKRNPRLVYCSITGYGQDSPYANRAQHDINVVATTGIMEACGPKSGPPIHYSLPVISDISALIYTMSSILSALYAREKTCRGQFLDVAITDGMIFSNWTITLRYLLYGEISGRSELPTGCDMAWLNTYKTEDGGYITISCLEPPLWANLCQLIGKEEFIPLHFSSIEDQEMIYKELSDIFSSKKRDEWIELLDKADVAAAPVLNIAEALSDDHVKHRGLVQEVNYPKMGKIKVLNNPLKFSDTPVVPRTRPPMYAENTDEILKNRLGVSVQEINDLREKGIIE